MKPQPTVVIAGASAGVGRATAHAFARLGARIGLIARDRQALEDTAEEVRRLGGQGLALPADIADAQAVAAAAEAAEDAFGPLDIWVNSAMLTVFSPVRKLTPEEIRRVTEVTYLGSVNGIMAALGRMLPRDHGTIVQVGSALAYRGIPLQAAYCGAKFAIRGFIDSLHSELLHDGSQVRVTMVQLPAVNTPQFDWARTHMPRQPRPVAPVFQPETIADTLVRAADEAEREYWLGRSTVQAILGAQLVPSYLDRYLARKVWDGQETEKPVSPDRRDNLFEPVHDLHRTHGRFDNEAQPVAIAYDPRTIRAYVIAAGLSLAAVIGAGLSYAIRLAEIREQRRYRSAVVIRQGR